MVTVPQLPSLPLTFLDASPQVSLPLVDGPLRPGSKVSIDSLWLASVDYNAVRIRAQPSSGAAGE